MLKFTANLSMLFTEVELINRFKAAKQNGFDAVEIQFPYSLSAEALKNILEEQQLKLVLFNVDADDLLHGGEGLACVPEKRDQFRQAVAQTLEYAKLLKPEVINVLPGRCYNENRKQD
ncbi:MAG: TIM barrel protein, partial [Methylobacter sp.]